MEERNTRRAIQGIVVSDKNDKTIGVLVETYKKHAKYGKRVKYRKKYYAHDENNTAKVGDTVTIVETRKLSATKRFRLVSIDKKAEMTVKEAEAELKEGTLNLEVNETPKEEVPEVKEEKTSVVEETKVEETPVVEEAPKAEAAPKKKTTTTKKTVAKKEEK